MDCGLLWFDNNPKREIEEKVQRAVAHYERKYGHTPNVCWVHPSMLQQNGGAELQASGVIVRPGRAILPDHFWLGVMEERGERRQSVDRRLQPVAM